MCELIQIERYQLSKIQYVCLAFYVTGHSAKETALELGKSVKTIETHIRDVRHIMGCRKKSQLTKMLYDLNQTDNCFKSVTESKNYRKTLGEKP